MPWEELVKNYKIFHLKIFFDGTYDGQICLHQFFGPINNENILVEGVKFIVSIFWNIVPVYSENIIISVVEVSNYGLSHLIL